MDTSRFILQPTIQYKKDGEKGSTIFEISPLNRGYGFTLGNTLRRILLSSIPGAAIVSVKFDGVNHELSGIKGVKNDVLSIMMKLKKVRVKINTGEQANIYIETNKEGKVFAGDFKISGDAEIINKDLEITEIVKGGSLNLECLVESGFGYLPIEDRQNEDLPKGFFPLDALFSPILNVRYYVENTRVGQVTNLDKLIMEIKTDGTISPKDALQKAVDMLARSSENLINAVRSATVADDKEKDSKKIEESLKSKRISQQRKDVKNLTVIEIGLSPRTQNALKNNGVETVVDIIKLGKSKLPTLKGVGGKAMKEILERIEELGIKL